MWLIEEKTFIDSEHVTAALKILPAAQKNRTLTLIVGNGPSRSAAWFHGKNNDFKIETPLDWSTVITSAAETVNIEQKLIKGNSNNLLALAQSVKLADQAKTLLDPLEAAFKNKLDVTHIEQMLVYLAPRDIVTTNYDFQLERAFFEKNMKKQVKVLVRHGEGRSQNDNEIWIHKMHGSFSPEPELMDRYRFAPPYAPDSANNSIVITESHYDECFSQIAAMDEKKASLMSALSQTCLIVGKSLDTQDLSFLLALRKTKNNRPNAFALFTEQPSLTEQLTLKNLDIKPLVINMPRHAEDGHYYVATVAALAKLFSDLPPLQKSFKAVKKHSSIDFDSLVQGPTAIAIGLVSHNIIGRTNYANKNEMPPPGRRNMRLENVEEHVGGSAMTAMTVLSALVKIQKLTLSISSSIGVPNSSYNREILDYARKHKIDTDAVSQNQESTWVSTVLVHESDTNNGKYPGQRIFLDRGYDKAVTLEAAEMRQLYSQLKQKNLKVLYLDKFLAQQPPPPKVKPDSDSLQFGPLLQQQTLNIMQQMLIGQPSLDVVYEAGSNGSYDQHVEDKLKPVVNIFTTGFPFFFNHIIPETERSKEIDSKEFNDEIKAIITLLHNTLGITDFYKSTGPRISALEMNDAMLTMRAKMLYWTRDNADRRWFIVTLHHYGVLGIDLKQDQGWYCKAPKPISKIENTAGAGDCFRGALMYALLEAQANNKYTLPCALMFATQVATERCYHFNMADARQSIEDKYGDKYRALEIAYMAELHKLASNGI
ncbi:MAG: SIR2 family protein [Algicola sp.]|nr:SIR2 family protein [Algicola sp.]